LFIESTKVPGLSNAVQDRHGYAIAMIRHLDSLSTSDESRGFRDCRPGRVMVRLCRFRRNAKSYI
jgi:hypothetical protein